jgi:hypothetical protein
MMMNGSMIEERHTGADSYKDPDTKPSELIDLIYRAKKRGVAAPLQCLMQ